VTGCLPDDGYNRQYTKKTRKDNRFVLFKHDGGDNGGVGQAPSEPKEPNDLFLGPTQLRPDLAMEATMLRCSVINP